MASGNQLLSVIAFSAINISCAHIVDVVDKGRFQYFPLSGEDLGMVIDVERGEYIVANPFDGVSSGLVECSAEERMRVCVKTRDFVFALPSENDLTAGKTWVVGAAQFQILADLDSDLSNANKRFLIEASRQGKPIATFIYSNRWGLEIIALLEYGTASAGDSNLVYREYGSVWIASGVGFAAQSPR